MMPHVSKTMTLHAATGVATAPVPMSWRAVHGVRSRRISIVQATVEAQQSAKRSAPASHADTFLHWAQSAGIVVPKLRPAQFAGGSRPHTHVRVVAYHRRRRRAEDVLRMCHSNYSSPAVPADRCIAQICTHPVLHALICKDSGPTGYSR